jgi:hypothetical protein
MSLISLRSFRFLTQQFATFLTLLLFLPFSGQSQVVINEIQSSNQTTIADDDGDFEDWIELYNAGPDTADISLFGLSDSHEEPFRWVLPESTVLEPGGFLLVWASGKDRRTPGQPLHTNFSIARDGEEILLSHPALPPGEQRIDEVPPTPIPSDLSWGRVTDGSAEWAYFDRPTPGQPNASSPGFGTILEMPEPSHQAGFHPEPFDLALTSPDGGAEIRFTLDGSKPGPDSELYSGPIPIADRSTQPNDLSEIKEITHRYAPAGTPYETVFKGTVVRARAYRDGDLPGPVLTGTYFIHPKSHARYTLPIVAINTERDHFFDHETGIYVLGRVHEEWLNAGGGAFNGGAPANYNRRGRDWERPAHFTLFEDDGTIAISQDIGVRIHGGWSRAFPHKSLRLYSRSDYGESRFRYRFFEHLELDDFNRLILRGSGQDQTATMFRDVYIQESVRHMNMDIQHFRPVVAFLNGEYWGIYNIRQRYDRHYFETHYDLVEGQLDLLTTSAQNPRAGDNADYLAMREFIDEEDLSEDALFEQVARQMDIDNFIDYFIANIFADNTDWPHNNIDFWRKNHGEYRPDALIPEHDGRWRWVLVDTDFGFGWQSSYSNNTMNRVTGIGREPWANTLLNGLLENRSFRDAFFNRFADMLNTTFQPMRMTALLDSLKAIYAPEIVEHINRRGDAGNWPYPRNYEDWVDKVEVMRRFAKQRPGYMWEQLAGYADLDTLRLVLDIAGPGTINVNTIAIDPATVDSNALWPWNGTYFSGIPVSLHARPEPGFKFVHWEEVTPEGRFTLSTDDSIHVTSIDSLHLVAEFRETDTSTPWEDDTPAAFALHSNYPNPFNPSTIIHFELAEPSRVRLDVFDITGRRIVRLLDEDLNTGRHRVTFDTSGFSGLASGVYLFRLEAGDFSDVRKMTLIR